MGLRWEAGSWDDSSVSGAACCPQARCPSPDLGTAYTAMLAEKPGLEPSSGQVCLSSLAWASQLFHLPVLCLLCGRVPCLSCRTSQAHNWGSQEAHMCLTQTGPEAAAVWGPCCAQEVGGCG